MYTTAQRAVANNTAFGTASSGFSTASALAQADSNPRKDHKVMVIALVAASPNGISCTFQFAAYISPEKKNQPAVEIIRIGAITPQTVTEPILPVMDGPPKFGNVVIHNTAIVAAQDIIGLSSASKNTTP